MADQWEEQAKQFKGGQASDQTAPAAPAAAAAPDGDWKLWQNGGQKEESTPSTPLSTLKDLGIGAAKGLESGATALPSMIGGALNHAMGYQPPQQAVDLEQYLPATDTAQKIGKYGEQALEMAVPLIGGIRALPTTAKAGALLEDVMGAAKNDPVNLTRSLQPLERMQQLTQRGGPAIGAADKLFNRINTVNPLSYEEARDFYSNFSRLSAADKMALNGPMKGALGEFTGAFKGDIGDTAAAAGKGAEYEKGMTDYARAAKLRDLGTHVKDNAVKYGVGAGLGALGLGALSRLF